MNLNVIYGGELVFRLNKHLVERQGLTEEDVEKIKSLHVERLSIEDQLASASRLEDIKTIYSWWVQNQRRLQAVWGFPVNDNFHPSHRLPHCICAKLDGDERLGTPYKVVTCGCPIHDPT